MLLALLLEIHSTATSNTCSCFLPQPDILYIATPRITPVNLPKTIRGLLQCPLWFFPPASFVAHTQTPGYSSLFPSRLVSSRLGSSEMTSVITSVSVDFNLPPVLPPASHSDPRSSCLCTSDLFPRASFCPVSHFSFISASADSSCLCVVLVPQRDLC